MNVYLTLLFLVLLFVAALAVIAYFFYRMVRVSLENEQKKALLELQQRQQEEALKSINPIRLQAYERMALFLERISPNSLVMRSYKPGMDLRQLQQEMTSSIRLEWEHNLSQQVYLSSECWSRIRNAKDEMINLINATASRMAQDADPVGLAGAIFESVALSKVPTDEALECLREEIHEKFEV